MNEKCKDSLIFTGVHLLQFVFVSANSFFKKEFFKFAPYPLFISFMNGIFMLPLAFFVTWSAHKFKRSIKFLKVPSQIWNWLLLSSLFNTVGIIVVNIGFFASALDFVLLFRLTSLVWNGIFGFLFLDERLNCLGFSSLGVVFGGIFFIVKDFEWSTAKLPSTTQIILQMLSIILQSINLLFNKKVINILSRIETEFQLLDFLFWKSTLLLPITFFSSIFFEPNSWNQFSNIFTFKFFFWIIFGTILHQSLHVTITFVQKITSMISLGVIAQLRVLGTLVISHFAYNETNWNTSKLFGCALLFSGGIMFSISRMTMEKSHKSESVSQDEEFLISGKSKQPVFP